MNEHGPKQPNFVEKVANDVKTRAEQFLIGLRQTYASWGGLKKKNNFDEQVEVDADVNDSVEKKKNTPLVDPQVFRRQLTQENIRNKQEIVKEKNRSISRKITLIFNENHPNLPYSDLMRIKNIMTNARDYSESLGFNLYSKDTDFIKVLTDLLSVGEEFHDPKKAKEKAFAAYKESYIFLANRT